MDKVSILSMVAVVVSTFGCIQPSEPEQVGQASAAASEVVVENYTFMARDSSNSPCTYPEVRDPSAVDACMTTYGDPVAQDYCLQTVKCVAASDSPSDYSFTEVAVSYGGADSNLAGIIGPEIAAIARWTATTKTFQVRFIDRYGKVLAAQRYTHAKSYFAENYKGDVALIRKLAADPTLGKAAKLRLYLGY